MGLAALASLHRTPLSRSLTIIFQSRRFSLTTSILPARSREEGQLAQGTGAPEEPLSAALGRYDYCCCCCYCSPGAQPDPDGESEAWRRLPALTPQAGEFVYRLPMAELVEGPHTAAPACRPLLATSFPSTGSPTAQMGKLRPARWGSRPPGWLFDAGPGAVCFQTWLSSQQQPDTVGTHAGLGFQLSGWV